MELLPILTAIACIVAVLLMLIVPRIGIPFFLAIVLQIAMYWLALPAELVRAHSDWQINYFDPNIMMCAHAYAACSAGISPLTKFFYTLHFDLNSIIGLIVLVLLMIVSLVLHNRWLFWFFIGFISMLIIFTFNSPRCLEAPEVNPWCARWNSAP